MTGTLRSPGGWSYWLNTWPGRPVLLTRANAADGYPRALTPLTQDLVVTYEDAGVRRFFAETLRAIRPSDAPMPYLSAMWGHVYINADQLAALGDVLPGSSKWSIYQQYMGLTPDPTFRAPRRRLPERVSGLRVAVPVLRGMLREAKYAGQRITEQVGEIKAMRRGVDADERQCLEWVLDLESVTVAAWESLMIGPGIASATFEVCQQVISKAVKDHGSGIELTNRLHVGLGNNESAEAGRMVHRLAAIARRNPELARAISGGAPVAEVRSLDEAFDRQIAKELDRFGFHAAPELELAQPTWRQDPEQVLTMVARALRRSDDADTSADLRDKAEAELRRRVRFGYRWLSRKVVAMSRKQMALRENAKIPIVLIFDELRRVLDVAGPQLVARGALCHAGDIVYLRYDELKGLLGGAGGPGAAEIERRRQDHRRCLDLEMPELVEAGPGYLCPASEQHIRDRGLVPPAEITESTTVLEGIGASSGTITATARVLTDPAENFEPGDVLIAKTVDPGWSAVLSCAGAVVLDIGGHLSHGAVVARELGIPCVVNTKAGTSVVRSGSTVSVDGATGKLVIL